LAVRRASFTLPKAFNAAPEVSTKPPLPERLPPRAECAEEARVVIRPHDHASAVAVVPASARMIPSSDQGLLRVLDVRVRAVRVHRRRAPCRRPYRPMRR